MFWGCEVTTTKPHSLQGEATLENDLDTESKMLHISNASLNTTKNTPSGGKFKLFCQAGEKKFLVASLKEGHTENYNLDLYFKQEEVATFSVSGKGEATVHLTGYWETSPDLIDDDYGMGPMEMDMEDDDDEADPLTREHIDEAKANALKNATLAAMQDESDEDSDDEEEVAPAAVVKTNKTVKVTAKAPAAVEEDSDEDSDDPVMPTGAAAQAAAQDDSDEDSDDAPALAQSKAPQFEDDSDESSDDFDMAKILANKKRKAEDAKGGNEGKRQKLDNNKEKQDKGNKGGKFQNKGGNFQNKGENFQNKGGNKHHKGGNQHHKGGNQHNKGGHNKGGQGNKKRFNKNQNKGRN